MVDLVIVADDLTGALDAAAPFAGRGLATRFALTLDAFEAALASGAQVVAITTASREIPAEDAARAAAEVARRIPPGTRVFKKVDSRLKGNIAAELSALDFRRALVAPAIPDFGRVVQAGAVRGFGVAAPIPVADCLGAFADRAEVPDVATTAEMEQALAGSDADLLIGARGLAEALARQMTAREARQVDRLPAPALFVVGSRDPITVAQAERLRATGVPRLEAPNGRLAAAVSEAALALVQAMPGETEEEALDVSARLAASVHPGHTAARHTLVMTGGATAEAVLRRMGIAELVLLGEALPGIVVARAGDLVIVTKSGGFGDENTLADLARMTEAP